MTNVHSVNELFLDLSSIPEPEASAVDLARRLTQTEREVVLQMFRHIPVIERNNCPPPRKHYLVTPNQPNAFYIGLGPIKNLVDKQILDIVTRNEKWWLSDRGHKVGYVLAIDSAIRGLQHSATHADVPMQPDLIHRETRIVS